MTGKEIMQSTHVKVFWNTDRVPNKPKINMLVSKEVGEEYLKQGRCYPIDKVDGFQSFKLTRDYQNELFIDKEMIPPFELLDDDVYKELKHVRKAKV